MSRSFGYDADVTARARLLLSSLAFGLSALVSTSADAAPKKKKKRRRKKGKQKKLQEGPPEKLCQGCSDQIKAFAPQEQPCKVHGCKETWSWDREHQLRAWVHAGRPEDPSATKPLKNQRRMCNSCRDFCRGTKDRDVVCGKPECEKTWKYKTGAQLQDKLAGRTADPIKLCEDCMKEQFVAPGVHTGALPEGSEVMPCGSAGCEGTWIYVPGMELQNAEGDEVPPDRMCDKCRGERGLPGRGVVVQSPEAVAAAEASAPETPANQAEAANEGESAAPAQVEASPEPAAESAPEPTAEAAAEPAAEAASESEASDENQN